MWLGEANASELTKLKVAIYHLKECCANQTFCLNKATHIMVFSQLHLSVLLDPVTEILLQCKLLLDTDHLCSQVLELTLSGHVVAPLVKHDADGPMS